VVKSCTDLMTIKPEDRPYYAERCMAPTEDVDVHRIAMDWPIW